VLTLAAAVMLWFALRGYRRERNVHKSLAFDVGSGLLLLVFSTVIPIGIARHSKPSKPLSTATSSAAAILSEQQATTDPLSILSRRIRLSGQRHQDEPGASLTSLFTARVMRLTTLR
jgi:hypothetical protein